MITQIDDVQVAIIIDNADINDINETNLNLPISNEIRPVILKKINNCYYLKPIFKIICIVFFFGVFCYFCYIVLRIFIA